MSKYNNHTSPFYVYLNSSDSLGHFESNTTSTFTNSLEKALILPQSQGWVVCLHSLFSSNLLIDNSKIFVKIHTSIISPTYGTEKVIALCTRRRLNYQANRIIQFEPRNKEYYPVVSSVIASIDIQLTDNQNTALRLGLGQSTLVILEFKKMERKKEFIIRVDSRDDAYGVANNFQAQLPPMLSIDPTRKWSVSLNSIIYDGKFRQVPPGTADPSISIKMDPLQMDSQIMFIVDRQDSTYFEQLSSNDDLFYKFSLLLNKFTGKDYNNGENFSPFVALRRNVTTNIFSFRSKYDTILKLPYTWAIMLGCTKLPDKDGQVTILVTPNKDVKFAQPMNYNAWVPNVMLLYVNCIEYSCIGHISAPILRAIPTPQISNETIYHTYEPQMLEAHKVTYSQLSNLQFQLCKIDGLPVLFTDERQNVIISLRFIQE